MVSRLTQDYKNCNIQNAHNFCNWFKCVNGKEQNISLEGHVSHKLQDIWHKILKISFGVPFTRETQNAIFTQYFHFHDAIMLKF